MTSVTSKGPSVNHNTYKKEVEKEKKVEASKTNKSEEKLQAEKEAEKNKPKTQVEGPSVSAQSGYSVSTGGVETSASVGDTDFHAYAEGPSFSIDGSASAEIDGAGISIDVTLDIDATLAEAGAGATHTVTTEIYGETFEVTLDLEAMGKIGVDGSLNLSLDIGANGVEVSASADGFAGAEASLTGGITLSHEGNEILSGEATLSATAGVAGEASFDAGFSDGAIEFEASAAASAGVGFGVDVSGSFNLQNAAVAAGAILEGALREGVEGLKDFATDLVGNAGEFIGDVGENIGDFLGDVGGFISDVGGGVKDLLGF